MYANVPTHKRFLFNFIGIKNKQDPPVSAPALGLLLFIMANLV